MDECIDEYIKLSKKVFEVDQVLKGIIPVGDNQCRFDYQQLEQAIKDIVRKKLHEEDATMADMGSENVPTFVVATKALHADGPPTLFRSYQCQGYNPNQCAIWEAARATSAAPTFFKSIKIEIPQPGATFVDGGLAHNNPAELALSEAQRIWTNAKRFCLVSVGTGRLKSVRVIDIQSAGAKEFYSSDRFVSWWIPGTKNETRNPSGLTALKKIAEACVELTTNSERVHQRLLKHALSTDPEKKFPYHRFNVERDMQDIGLQEWYKIEEMAVHTTAYMEEGEGELKRNKCVQDLMSPPDIECKKAIFHRS